jgi:hypothetical protein
MAELYYRTRPAGEPIVLDPSQLAETRAKISGYGRSKQTSGGTGQGLGWDDDPSLPFALAEGGAG